MNCSVPDNQSIYEAPIDKAASYPVDKPVIYTAENPRRLNRNANKPKLQYFNKKSEDSDDNDNEDSDEEYIDIDEDVAEAIKTICVRKGWAYSDELVTDFETWLSSAAKYYLTKYDWHTAKYIPCTKPDVAKYWLQSYSENIQEQKKQLALSKPLIKYCEKNNIQYQDVMCKKFAEWKADEVKTAEYRYDRSPTYCINKWFSTLKKSIVW